MIMPVNYETLSQTERKKVREKYVAEQKGLCYYCSDPLHESPSMKILKMDINRSLFPKNFFKYPVHLHHDHNTGMTIGAVHNKCNAVLWQYDGE